MKTISIFLVILFVSLQSFGQNQALSKEDYSQKSKNQKTTGWILLASGTTMAVAGLISMSNQDFWSSDNSSYDASGFLFFGRIGS